MANYEIITDVLGRCVIRHCTFEVQGALAVEKNDRFIDGQVDIPEGNSLFRKCADHHHEMKKIRSEDHNRFHLFDPASNIKRGFLTLGSSALTGVYYEEEFFGSLT